MSRWRGSFGARLAHAYQQLKDAALFEGLLPLLLAIPFAVGDAFHRVATESSPAVGAAGFPCGKDAEGAASHLAPRGAATKLAAGMRFDLLFPLVWLAYWFYIGGDHFFDRFLIILYPMGIFTLLKLLSGNGKIVAYVVTVLALMQAVPPFKVDPRFQYDFHKYDCWISTGKFLGKTFPGKTLATGALGKIPFFSGLYTQDILGLTDPVLARRPARAGEFLPGNMKFDADYTLSRHPDLIANWIRADLNLTYGLSRAQYEKTGYQLAFLAYTHNRPPDPAIVNVQGWDDRAIQQEIIKGYDFAVLVRK